MNWNLIMKNRNSQRIKIADKEEVQVKAANNQAGILIVSDYPVVRKGLVELINQKPDLGVCIEVESTNQSWDTISERQIDLAIIDISFKDTNSSRLADTIKLQRPDLPIILLSVNNRISHAEPTLQAETKEPSANQQVTEQIIKTIHYAQSLLKSHIFGFTLFVNLERSLQDDH